MSRRRKACELSVFSPLSPIRVFPKVQLTIDSSLSNFKELSYLVRRIYLPSRRRFALFRPFVLAELLSLTFWLPSLLIRRLSYLNSNNSFNGSTPLVFSFVLFGSVPSSSPNLTRLFSFSSSRRSPLSLNGTLFFGNSKSLWKR